MLIIPSVQEQAQQASGATPAPTSSAAAAFKTGYSFGGAGGYGGGDGGAGAWVWPLDQMKLPAHALRLPGTYACANAGLNSVGALCKQEVESALPTKAETTFPTGASVAATTQSFAAANAAPRQSYASSAFAAYNAAAAAADAATVERVPDADPLTELAMISSQFSDASVSGSRTSSNRGSVSPSDGASSSAAADDMLDPSHDNLYGVGDCEDLVAFGGVGNFFLLPSPSLGGPGIIATSAVPRLPPNSVGSTHTPPYSHGAGAGAGANRVIVPVVDGGYDSGCSPAYLDGAADSPGSVDSGCTSSIIEANVHKKADGKWHNWVLELTSKARKEFSIKHMLSEEDLKDLKGATHRYKRARAQRRYHMKKATAAGNLPKVVKAEEK